MTSLTSRKFSVKKPRVQDNIVETPALSKHKFLPQNRVDFAKFIREDFPTDRGGYDTGHRSSYIAPTYIKFKNPTFLTFGSFVGFGRCCGWNIICSNVLKARTLRPGFLCWRRDS